LAFVANGSHAIIYVDGSEDGIASFAGDIYTGTSNLLIGEVGGYSTTFNGSIDEVMVWNRSLSDQEIKSLYDASNFSYYRNFTTLSDSLHSFTAYAVDSAGNMNETETREASTGNTLYSCQTINTAGIYTLGQDITTSGSCFTISASNVTLDGNGYSITGDAGASDYGITTPSDSSLVNITIKNFGNIGNFTRGINLDMVNDSLIVNNTMISSVAENTYALYVQDGDSNRIENNTIEWNATGASKKSYGVYLYVSSGSYGNNNVSGNNMTLDSASSFAYGIYLGNLGTSNSNTIQDNTFDLDASSFAYGIYLN
jgi:hypothetical protein